MTDYTYHGDGSVTVTPSKGQTGSGDPKIQALIDAQPKTPTVTPGSGGGTYTDPKTGQSITKEQAAEAGLIDKPGEFGQKAISSGVSAQEIMSQSSPELLKSNLIEFGAATPIVNKPIQTSGGGGNIPTDRWRPGIVEPYVTSIRDVPPYVVSIKDVSSIPTQRDIVKEISTDPLGVGKGFVGAGQKAAVDFSKDPLGMGVSFGGEVLSGAAETITKDPLGVTAAVAIGVLVPWSNIPRVALIGVAALSGGFAAKTIIESPTPSKQLGSELTYFAAGGAGAIASGGKGLSGLKSGLKDIGKGFELPKIKPTSEPKPIRIDALARDKVQNDIAWKDYEGMKDAGRFDLIDKKYPTPEPAPVKQIQTIDMSKDFVKNVPDFIIPESKPVIKFEVPKYEPKTTVTKFEEPQPLTIDLAKEFGFAKYLKIKNKALDLPRPDTTPISTTEQFGSITQGRFGIEGDIQGSNKIFGGMSYKPGKTLSKKDDPWSKISTRPRSSPLEVDFKPPINKYKQSGMDIEMKTSGGQVLLQKMEEPILKSRSSTTKTTTKEARGSLKQQVKFDLRETKPSRTILDKTKKGGIGFALFNLGKTKNIPKPVTTQELQLVPLTIPKQRTTTLFNTKTIQETKVIPITDTITIPKTIPKVIPVTDTGTKTMTIPALATLSKVFSIGDVKYGGAESPIWGSKRRRGYGVAKGYRKSPILKPFADLEIFKTKKPIKKHRKAKRK